MQITYQQQATQVRSSYKAYNYKSHTHLQIANQGLHASPEIFLQLLQLQNTSQSISAPPKFFLQFLQRIELSKILFEFLQL